MKAKTKLGLVALVGAGLTLAGCGGKYEPTTIQRIDNRDINGEKVSVRQDEVYTERDLVLTVEKPDGTIVEFIDENPGRKPELDDVRIRVGGEYIVLRGEDYISKNVIKRMDSEFREYVERLADDIINISKGKGRK